MRAGPLSQMPVINLLNSYFVPVYAVNEDYRKEGAKPKKEKAEYSRIYREALENKMSAGSVHVYLVHPSGEVFDSIHVADAAKESALEKRLQAAVQKLG